MANGLFIQREQIMAEKKCGCDKGCCEPEKTAEECDKDCCDDCNCDDKECKESEEKE